MGRSTVIQSIEFIRIKSVVARLQGKILEWTRDLSQNSSRAPEVFCRWVSTTDWDVFNSLTWAPKSVALGRKSIDAILGAGWHTLEGPMFIPRLSGKVGANVL
jgi:hypothetical protein